MGQVIPSKQQAYPECDVLHVTQSGVEVMWTSCEGQVQQLNLFEGG
ncbi:hypothetical protein KSD_56340 [Ktedonobacter sp. SOSP1-85]|nr:hypothetical protein KSD_56340 [Ktedonobacter sp. SOSP1-85]